MYEPVISMQSVMNLSYKSKRSLKHPKPENFAEMKERAMIN